MLAVELLDGVRSVLFQAYLDILFFRSLHPESDASQEAGRAEDCGPDEEEQDGCSAGVDGEPLEDLTGEAVVGGERDLQLHEFGARSAAICEGALRLTGYWLDLTDAALFNLRQFCGRATDLGAFDGVHHALKRVEGVEEKRPVRRGVFESRIPRDGLRDLGG